MSASEEHIFRPPETHILRPEDCRDLQEQRLLSPATVRGTQLLHTRYLDLRSDIANGTMPFTGDYSQPQEREYFTEIPVQFISHATLEFIGFSKQKADELWWRWEGWDNFSYVAARPRETRRRETDPEDGREVMTFQEFFTHDVIHAMEPAVQEDDSQWENILKNVHGLNEKLQDLIMYPRSKPRRIEKSCKFWVKYSLEVRYKRLGDIHKESVRRVEQLGEDPLQLLLDEYGEMENDCVLD